MSCFSVFVAMSAKSVFIRLKFIFFPLFLNFSSPFIRLYSFARRISRPEPVSPTRTRATLLMSPCFFTKRWMPFSSCTFVSSVSAARTMLDCESVRFGDFFANASCEKQKKMRKTIFFIN